MKQAWSKEEIEALASDITNDAIEGAFEENLVANPELEGDEETLSSIRIKGTNYALGGGSEKLYRHEIYLEFTNQLICSLIIISKSSTAFDTTSLLGFLESISNASTPYQMTGIYIDNNVTYNVLGIFYSSNPFNKWGLDYFSSGLTISQVSLSTPNTLRDTVTEIQ